jgi:hypothetical protein
LDTVDRILRQGEAAESPEAKASAARERDFLLAKIGATLSIYAERGGHAIRMGETAVDWMLAKKKRVDGIAALLGAAWKLIRGPE